VLRPEGHFLLKYRPQHPSPSFILDLPRARNLAAESLLVFYFGNRNEYP